MNTTTEKDAVSDVPVWGASDTLLLEGLNGLEVSVGSGEETKASPQPVDDRLASTSRSASGNFQAAKSNSKESGSVVSPFTIARPASVASQASDRSGEPERNGESDRLPRGKRFEQAASAVVKAPIAGANGGASPPSKPGIANGSRGAPNGRRRRPSHDLQASEDEERASRPGLVRPLATPLRNGQSDREPIAARSLTAVRAEMAEKKVPSSEGARDTIGEPVSVDRARVTSSPVLTQTEPEVVKRRVKSSSSFFPSVVTSLLLTSLIWGALLVTFWQFVGDEWLKARVQSETVPLSTGLGEEIRVARTELTENLHEVQESLIVLRARHQQFVRMCALESAMYSDHSRQRFEEFLDIGRRLETGSEEEDYFRQTKGRIESAYTKRLGQHRGLAVRQLFPQLSVTKESNLGASHLMEFVANTNAPGWDRARAAVLLRQFPENDGVIAQLVQLARDDQDLQVFFAAWDSLLSLTGYEPGSKGFSPSDFDRWWSVHQA